MSNIFFKQVDPFKYAKEKRVLSGSVPIDKMHKLYDKSPNLEGAVEVELKFQLIKNNLITCKGFILGDVPLECQRTLEHYSFHINHNFSIVIYDGSKEINHLTDEYEPFLFDGSMIIPLELIEEEILLALPLVPKKALKDCKSDKNSAYYDPFFSDKIVGVERENPFAVLSKLKK
ncbi:MAG: hypothetical protein ACJA0H_000451 [Francisellaceae bacterium]|jgi:uncharacterized protein